MIAVASLSTQHTLAETIFSYFLLYSVVSHAFSTFLLSNHKHSLFTRLLKGVISEQSASLGWWASGRWTLARGSITGRRLATWWHALGATGLVRWISTWRHPSVLLIQVRHRLIHLVVLLVRRRTLLVWWRHPLLVWRWHLLLGWTLAAFISLLSILLCLFSCHGIGSDVICKPTVFNVSSSQLRISGNHLD